MDRLIEAIDNTQNPSVVGLDPTEALVPPQVVASFADEVRDSVESPEEVESAQLAVAYFEYNRTIIDAIADIVPAVKPQIAMYEALGPAGVDIYTMTCEYAAQQGLYVPRRHQAWRHRLHRSRLRPPPERRGRLRPVA